jgi:hypothetical protein
LDNQLAREVRRLDFTALFAPKAEESGFVAPHNDPGVGAAYKGTSFNVIYGLRGLF